MGKFDLLKSQKNEIFRLMTSSGFDPSNFVWEESSFDFEGRQMMKTICFINTDYYFQIFINGGVFQGEFSPGETLLVETFSTYHWTIFLNYIRHWLSCLKKEINQPDLWERIKEFQLPSDIRLSDDQENSKFNYSEFTQIKEGLENLKGFFETQLTLESDQQKYVHEKIDYLVESSKKQGRKDFYYLLVGSLISIITTLSIGPEHGKAIWGIVKNMFLGLVKALPG